MADSTTVQQNSDISLPFKEVLNLSSMQVYIADIAGRLVWVNDAACDILGYSRNELLNMRVYDVDKETTKADWQALVADFDDNSRTTIMSEHQSSSGEVVHVEVSIFTIPYQDSILICGFSKDISERVKLEQQVSKLNQTYYSAINTTGIGFWVVSPKGQIIETNEAYVHMSGFSREEITQMHIWELDATEEDVDTSERMKEIAKRGSAVFTTTQRRKDGSLYPVQVETSYSQIDEGVFFAFIRDITNEIEQEEKERQAAEAISLALKKTVYALGATVEKRDPYTAGHEASVAKISRAIGIEMGLDDNFIEGLELGAIIHDIGNIHVPAEILNKPKSLNQYEMALVKHHTEVGRELVENIDFEWPIAEMIAQHHERLDGSGYPLGLKGDEIILQARIIAVADTLDAMVSHRPYRPAVGLNAAMEELKVHSGHLYDEVVVNACESLVSQGALRF